MTSPLRFLLDTNIISDLVRNPNGRVTQHIKANGEDSVCTSIIVAAELRFGVEKKGSSRLKHQLQAILSALTILPFEDPADRCYAQIRNHIEESGNPIGPNDMLIAAHSMALNLVAVTANIQEFSRIPQIKVENWLT